MAQKKPFALRLDPELLKAVEKWAADEFRSVNGQLEWLITRYLRERGRMGPEKSTSKRTPPHQEGSANADPSSQQSQALVVFVVVAS